jgi:hypothetical protein
MIRRLGKAWPRLHRLVYPLTALALLHFFLQSSIPQRLQPRRREAGGHAEPQERQRRGRHLEAVHPRPGGCSPP